MITRETALKLLDEHIKNENLKKHCIATEAIMRKMAEKFDQNKDKWGVTGLLHDLDFEYTSNTPERHGLETIELLEEYNLPDDVIHAIKSHNEEGTGVSRETTFDYALTCSESITGLIVATALVYPDKKVGSVKPKSVRKRMKEKAFARNVSRGSIMMCEKIDIPLNEFIKLSLEAMSEISDELGL